MSLVKKNTKKILLWLTRRYFQSSVQDSEISIFSNDCWGGEIYQHLQAPYLTPFIGLAIMAPCYIKLLKRPYHYLTMLPMEFVTESRYEACNVFRKQDEYPLARIDDIEIHFLHYKTPQEAASKWSRRIKRINWDKIYVKFDVGKDYATPEMVKHFLQLPFDRKLVIAPSHFMLEENSSIVTISNYTGDATQVFYESIKQLDIIRWLNSGDVYEFEKFGKLKGIALSRGLWMTKLL